MIIVAVLTTGLVVGGATAIHRWNRRRARHARRFRRTVTPITAAGEGLDGNPVLPLFPIPSAVVLNRINDGVSLWRQTANAENIRQLDTGCRLVVRFPDSSQQAVTLHIKRIDSVTADQQIVRAENLISAGLRVVLFTRSDKESVLSLADNFRNWRFRIDLDSGETDICLRHIRLGVTERVAKGH